MNELGRKVDRESSKAKKYHRKVGYFAILGGALAILGLGVALFVSILFWEGLISMVLGSAILIFCMMSYGYSSVYSSRERIKQGKVMTVYDAMMLHVYYPSWMRDWSFGWIPLVPFGIFLILGAVHLIPMAVAWFLFFVYGGSILLYQYLYARRWVAKHQKKEVV